MSPIVVIVVLVLLALILVAYAIVIQTVTTKKKQQKRLINALEARAAGFSNLINGFPDGVLPPTIYKLAHVSLIEVYQQLSVLQPNNTDYPNKINELSQAMSQPRTDISTQAIEKLDNIGQMREIKALLDELFLFI